MAENGIASSYQSPEERNLAMGYEPGGTGYIEERLNAGMIADGSAGPLYLDEDIARAFPDTASFVDDYNTAEA